MIHPLRPFTLLALLLAGCGHAPAPQPSPAAQLADAEERILAQHMIKQHLLKADPIERQIENHLQRDPRVTSARFAISIPHYGEEHTGQHLYFAVIVTTRNPMTHADAMQLLDGACASAACRITYWDRTSLAMDQNTWGLSFGTLIPISTSSPDLSPLTQPTTQPNIR